jgi:hypothetical protein
MNNNSLLNVDQIEVPKIHLIDCDAVPFCESCGKIEYSMELPNRVRGQWEWDPKVSLYLSKKQVKGDILGNDLYQELADKSVLKDNVLNYLLAHQELVPEGWEGKKISFWGTVYWAYEDYQDCYFVRSLVENYSGWTWEFSWLDRHFDSNNFAAIANKI